MEELFMKTTIFFLLTLALGSFAASPALADGGGGGGGRDSKLEPYQSLIDDEKYEQAIAELDKALEKDADDPDLLNLVAYSHRQLKRYEIALNYYQRALEIEPDHRGANEYLGELYLHLGQLEKAEERLSVLDKECFFGCREFDKLERAIEIYRRENAS